MILHLNKSEEPLDDASCQDACKSWRVFFFFLISALSAELEIEEVPKFDSSPNLCTFNCIENLTENYAVCIEYKKKASDEK